MALINELPCDIFDQIIELIPKIDLRFKVCLVCKSWVRPIRENIFTNISVLGRNAGGHSGFIAFAAFLEASPHICKLIRHLVLHGARYPPTPNTYVCANDVDAILTLLPNLQSLSLKDMEWYTREYSLTGFHGPYNLQRLRIQDMECKKADSILQLLGLFGTIQELSMFRMTDLLDFVWDDSSVVSDFVEGIAHSESFPSHLAVTGFTYDQLDDIVFYCRMLMHTQTMQTLRSFPLQLPRKGHNSHILGLPEDDIIDFLQAASGLQRLTFDFAGLVDESMYKPVDLDPPREYISAVLPSVLVSLRALTSCTLRMALTSTYDRLPAVWAIYVQVVVALPPQVRLIDFVLEDDAYNHIPEAHRAQRSCKEIWLLEELDLRGLQSALQRFTDLDVIMFRGSKRVTPAERARITAAFPGLYKKGLIQFDSA